MTAFIPSINVLRQMVYHTQEESTHHQLQQLINQGNVSALDTFLRNHRETVNTPLLNKDLPIIYAIKSGNRDVVSKLLKFGADATKLDDQGLCAIQYAKLANDENMLAVIFKKIANSELQKAESLRDLPVTNNPQHISLHQWVLFSSYVASLAAAYAIPKDAGWLGTLIKEEMPGIRNDLSWATYFSTFKTSLPAVLSLGMEALAFFCPQYELVQTAYTAYRYVQNIQLVSSIWENTTKAFRNSYLGKWNALKQAVVVNLPSAHTAWKWGSDLFNRSQQPAEAQSNGSKPSFVGKWLKHAWQIDISSSMASVAKRISEWLPKPKDVLDDPTPCRNKINAYVKEHGQILLEDGKPLPPLSDQTWLVVESRTLENAWYRNVCRNAQYRKETVCSQESNNTYPCDQATREFENILKKPVDLLDALECSTNIDRFKRFKTDPNKKMEYSQCLTRERVEFFEQPRERRNSINFKAFESYARTLCSDNTGYDPKGIPELLDKKLGAYYNVCRVFEKRVGVLTEQQQQRPLTEKESVRLDSDVSNYREIKKSMTSGKPQKMYNKGFTDNHLDLIKEVLSQLKSRVHTDCGLLPEKHEKLWSNDCKETLEAFVRTDQGEPTQEDVTHAFGKYTALAYYTWEEIQEELAIERFQTPALTNSSSEIESSAEQQGANDS